ncbi:MAG: glutamate-1-semialdehyde 2,1-aminomutase [Elusimicrobia bacterium]|nr:glutamate-1-semialdehyde 2,1-aminomutase [Elusimicrobiota bacterium]
MAIQSKRLFEKAKQILVGGVNSPVRSFGAVGGHPLFIKKAAGAYLWDADNQKYVDLVCSWGTIILGHGYPTIAQAAARAIAKGTSYGACHQNEILLAQMIREAFPKTIERVRLVNSGTEAVMTALRIARAATKRDLTVKFAGGYHGHHDSLLAAAGSGVLTHGLPSSAGVPESWAKTTLVLPYNDEKAVFQTFAKLGRKIAAVIVEPLACNMGVVPPEKSFLETLRCVTKKYGALLIFDEVITGFRLQWGGLSESYDPDLVCLGKIIGGGFPLAAVAGKKAPMELLAPLGKVYHAGTLSGNPVAVAAGLATLAALKKINPYARLEKMAQKIVRSAEETAGQKGIALTAPRQGSLFTLFFTAIPVKNYADAQKTDTRLFSKFFWNMVNSGIYWPPSNFEACFLSNAHADKDAEKIANAVHRAIKSL